MADLSDVMATLVSVCTGIVYPNGTGNPSIVTVPVLVYPGWPDATSLDRDLANLNNNAGGQLHLSVYPRPGEETVTTRYKDIWYPLSYAAPTLTITTNGQVVTLGGTPLPLPQNVAIVTAHAKYLYAVQANDTLTSIATALAALIPGASSSGAAITVPALTQITAARVGGSGQLFRERKRQRRTFQLSIWANNDANRTALAGPLDVALAGIEFITFPDGTAGRLIYRSTPETDAREQVNLFRRDLFYTLEYGTIQIAQATEVVAGEVDYAVILPDGTSPVIATTYQ